MPLTLQLEKEIAPGVWSARGTLKTSDGKEGEADVLLQEIKQGKGRKKSVAVKLMLDSSLKRSTIMNREVTMYTNAPEVPVEKPAEGLEVAIAGFWFASNK